MSKAHSSVNYVEPNLTASGYEKASGVSNVNPWKVDDNYERAPRLEDYSIFFNLEVEICSRENISANKTISTDVLILSYRTKPNSTESTVNFMGGTKVNTGNKAYEPMQYLTTNYADMYVGDLIDYGTTEMIGVKSVDIEYPNSCVPIVTVKFTDVRGISLFQPTELSRTNSYQGIKGINADNVAQSFFQCFFRVPMPRFTMTIKGFYGKPVTYECMCDKFDTRFNSNTGDFDITTRFIGYSYSFLTDVSIDALLAAPYSDYGGKNGNYNKYWDEQINNGTFTIWNKEKTQRDKIPTLFEVWQSMKSLMAKKDSTETVLDDEEKTHINEIQELTEIRDLYKKWYEVLFDVCSKKFGKDFCYLFQSNGRNSNYYRILILTSENTYASLKLEYEQFPEEFKLINKNLYSTVENFNASSSKFKKLESPSLSFVDYIPLRLFNKMYLGLKDEVVFNGFDNSNRLQETQVMNTVFYGVDYNDEKLSQEEINNMKIQHKNHILETIYNDGEEQYIKCYAIELDYSALENRINALQLDANKSEEEKTKQKRIKELNRKMLSELSWYPSVENFTRIMMAHMQTFMHLMYDVVTKCEGRTAGELGVTTGPDGNCVDVNASKDVIPPFPRVTKNVLGDDGITKVEDTWVGEYNKGTRPFEEVDFIDGFFNAIEKLQAIKKDTDQKINEMNKDIVTESESYGGIIKHPLSSFDFFISKNPYGDSNDISNDLELFQFSSKIAFRMFNIMTINYFRKEFSKSFSNDEFIKNLARTEAENFYKCVRLNNDKFIGVLRDTEDVPTKILNIITQKNKSENCPWGEQELFTTLSGNTIWLTRYSFDGNRIYPIQCPSFSKLDEMYNCFKEGKLRDYEGNVSLSTIPKNVVENEVNTKSGYGNVIITEDINLPNKCLNDANSDCDSGYTEFYDSIVSSSTFNNDIYASFMKVSDAPSICLRKQALNDKKIENFSIKDNFIEVDSEAYKNESIEEHIDEIKNGNTSNYTITEIFGLIGNSKDGYERNEQSSFLNSVSKLDVNNIIICGNHGLNSNAIKKALALLSIKTNESNLRKIYVSNFKTFIYMPKILLLKLSAICFAMGELKKYYFSNVADLDNVLKENLNIKSNFISKDLKDVAISLSRLARYQYAMFFFNWCNNNSVGKDFLNIISDKNNYITSKDGVLRSLLNQNSKSVTNMVNDLLRPVLVINLSVNSKKGVNKDEVSLPIGKAKVFITEFVNKINEIYKINYKEDSEGNLIKTTDEPKQTTDDMKAELYRYMKQLYDKWVPMSSFDDWTIDKFFLKEGEDVTGEEMGHKFYFIDSYYNDIGHKLLINPKNLMERVDALLGSGDINAMMLGFMADIYAFNRCMLKCIQNFFNLTKEGSMNEMFVPMSFNSINWSSEVNKYSSFVVVYPYEASKNLNIPNNEYNDDGFMLNDENETPKAIKSKSDVKGHYKIPAFGVAYGKQYQSYFKSVNINMKSPVATQQSIQAKHYILQESQNVKNVGVTAQDLYDIYSTQSYTCDVEMMGCAWIQPLMYFVLLNVPMFRGSYLIMSVKHSIKPGDMTTTFTGCRMANVSNKLVEDIFTDDDFLKNGTYDENGINNRYLKADIDNDCPYKIYPLWGDDNIELSKDEMENAQNAMSALINTYSFTKEAAAGMCGNIFKESTWRLHALNGIGAFGLCQWLGERKSLLINKFGSQPSFSQQLNYINYEWYNESVAKSHRDELMRQNTPEDAAYIVRKYFERPGDSEADDATRKGRARKYFDSYGTKTYETNTETNKDPNDKKDVIQAFFDAVSRSALDTPSIGVKLKKEIVGSHTLNYLKITQESGNDKLGTVFDMILNSEYYNYVEELGWIYPNGGLETGVPPTSIFCLVKEKVEPNKKHIWITETHKLIGSEEPSNLTDGNSILLKALAKHAKNMEIKDFKKEVRQVKDEKILDKYKPQDCDSLFESSSRSLIDINVTNVECGVNNGKIGDWNVATSANFLIEHARDSWKQEKCKPNNKLPDLDGCVGKCWGFVKRALRAGGFPLADSESAYQAKSFLEEKGFKCIKKGKVNGHKGTEYGEVCLGDITVFEPYDSEHPHGHINMWCGKQWISDFKQEGNWINGSAATDFSVWRYSGKGMK